MTWNHRIQRRVEVGPTGETHVSYGIVEAHYDKRGDKTPVSWTEDYMAPTGETLPELIKDFAWFMAALRHPVIDHNGAECEPAALLADEIQQWANAVTEAKGNA